MNDAIFEIVTIGNELLIGKTLNTNAQWLAKRITELGGFVKRCTSVRDNIKEIGAAVNEAIKRGAKWIIICGGLGSTFDDLTLQGVASAVSRPLVLNRRAVALMKRRYSALKEKGIVRIEKMTPHRLKMAMLPKGSKPLMNPAGMAPGVHLKFNQVNIICLPGVPSEMQAIFDENVVPLIRLVIGRKYFYDRSLNVTSIVESELAPLLNRVMHDNPQVYIKSHPKGVEGSSRIELHLTTSAEMLQVAKNRIEKAANEISQYIIKSGGKVESI
jgi:molybdenum cofactor synthesis domain-containing protein